MQLAKRRRNKNRSVRRLQTNRVDSPLRRADPRVRLALALCASLAVMLPLSRLLIFIAGYLLLLLWSRLLPAALQRLWRLRWLLLILFAADWFLVDLAHAVLVVLRVMLLAGSFAFLVETTSPGELRLVLQWLRVPHRYAFSLSVAFQSINLLGREWELIQEAQQARGAWQPAQWQGWRGLPGQVRQMVALTVPAVVLTARRAWNLTEAAHARGFDAPQRRPFHTLTMRPFDWVLLTLLLTASGLILFW